jgi:5'(3')-deoxyribonucleotidase
MPKNENWKILLDMDGVVVDFIRGICDFYDMDYGSTIDNWNPLGEYDLTQTVAFREAGIDQSEFYPTLAQRPMEFWRNLLAYPNAPHLYNLINGGFKNWLFVSAPIPSAACYAGKFEWVNDFLEQRATTRLILTRHKEWLAAPYTLLIDDSDSNVKQFVKAGGHAILYPQPWNSNANYGMTVMGWDENLAYQYVKNELAEITK